VGNEGERKVMMVVNSGNEVENWTG